MRRLSYISLLAFSISESFFRISWICILVFTSWFIKFSWKKNLFFRFFLFWSLHRLLRICYLKLVPSCCKKIYRVYWVEYRSLYPLHSNFHPFLVTLSLWSLFPRFRHHLRLYHYILWFYCCLARLKLPFLFVILKILFELEPLLLPSCTSTAIIRISHS